MHDFQFISDCGKFCTSQTRVRIKPGIHGAKSFLSQTDEDREVREPSGQTRIENQTFRIPNRTEHRTVRTAASCSLQPIEHLSLKMFGNTEPVQINKKLSA